MTRAAGVVSSSRPKDVVEAIATLEPGAGSRMVIDQALAGPSLSFAPLLVLDPEAVDPRAGLLDWLQEKGAQSSVSG